MYNYPPKLSLFLPSLSPSLPPSLYMSTGAAFVLPPLTPEVAVDVNTASVLFDCLTDGNIPPVTSHSWTFNGQLISSDSSKYILHPNGSLAVNNIELSDAGVYTCTPENDLGSFNSSNITLTVNGKEIKFRIL